MTRSPDDLSPPDLQTADPLRDDPLHDARALIASLPGPDAARVDRAEAALGAFGPLGPLRSLILWLAAWPGPAAADLAVAAPLRRVQRPLIAIYCASYALDGAAAERARARLERLAAGGGAVGDMAQALGAGVEVFDLAVDRPSPDPLRSPGDVMSARALAATLAFGMEAVAKSPDLLVLAADTEGADAAAFTLCAALQADPSADPLRLLRRHAGREVAALTGAILAAGAQRVPVILDGAPAEAAAAVLRAMAQGALGHVRSAGDIAPMADVGEAGAAAAAALALVRAAASIGAG